MRIGLLPVYALVGAVPLPDRSAVDTIFKYTGSEEGYVSGGVYGKMSTGEIYAIGGEGNGSLKSWKLTDDASHSLANDISIVLLEQEIPEAGNYEVSGSCPKIVFARGAAHKIGRLILSLGLYVADELQFTRHYIYDNSAANASGDTPIALPFQLGASFEVTPIMIGDVQIKLEAVFNKAGDNSTATISGEDYEVAEMFIKKVNAGNE